MKRPAVALLHVLHSVAAAAALNGGDGGRSTFVQANVKRTGERMKMHVVRHEPCAQSYHEQYKTQAPHEAIVFPHSGKSPVVEDSRHPGCYYIKGNVAVLRDIRSDLEMYVELRYTADESEPPERCFDPDAKTGCGGYGSCVYCDGCGTIRKDEVSTVARIRIVQGDRTVACDKHITKGYHTDIAIYFCMPPERDFIRNLKGQGISRDGLQALLDAKGWDSSRLGIFMNIYIFDESVRQNVTDQQYLEKVVTQDWQVGLPKDVLPTLPMYQVVKKLPPRYIGCHKIYGTLQMDLKQADWSDASGEARIESQSMGDRRYQFFARKRRERTLGALRRHGFSNKLVSHLRALDARNTPPA